MRKVFLHGELGNSLGKEWELEVDSVQEALWAIEANTNRLTQFLMKNNEKFTHYAFAIDDKDLDEHQLKSPIGDNNRAIHIMPQVAGGVEWLVYIVVMIVVSLIIQAIFRPPKPKDAIETNSYLFTGTENVAAQGVPVPLGYGRLRVWFSGAFCCRKACGDCSNFKQRNHRVVDRNGEIWKSKILEQNA